MDILINIDVSDVDVAQHFYCSAFDLRLARRLGEGAVELEGKTCKIYLLAQKEGSQATPAGNNTRCYRRHWTPIHLDFVVDSIEPAVEKSLAAGAVQESPIRDNPWGKIALMSDLFGNGYCLIELSTEGYDALVT